MSDEGPAQASARPLASRMVSANPGVSMARDLLDLIEQPAARVGILRAVEAARDGAARGHAFGDAFELGGARIERLAHLARGAGDDGLAVAELPGDQELADQRGEDREQDAGADDPHGGAAQSCSRVRVDAEVIEARF